MEQEIDRMMLLRKLCIISFIVICVIVVGIVGALIVMNTGDYSGNNSDFARIKDYGNVTTKTVDFEKCDTLYFFSETENRERTLFEDKIPKLKIVNSDKYCVEITAGEALLDRLDIEQKESGLIITFREDCYNDIRNGKKQYKGLYVDTDIFEVTVYAPISVLISSAEFDLDFDTPKTEMLAISVSGEIRKGSVYNIDANTLYCALNGASTVKMSGQVKNVSQFKVRHNSKIDAMDLKTPVVYTSSTSQLFGLSYIKGETFSDYSIMTLGFFATVGMVVLLAVCVGAFIVLRKMFVKQRNEIDQFIEKVETEGNFLIKE